MPPIIIKIKNEIISLLKFILKKQWELLKLLAIPSMFWGILFVLAWIVLFYKHFLKPKFTLKNKENKNA